MMTRHTKRVRNVPKGTPISAVLPAGENRRLPARRHPGLSLYRFFTWFVHMEMR